jgi:hypothetical protein
VIVVGPVLVNEARGSKPKGRLWWAGQLSDHRGTYSAIPFLSAFYKLGLHRFTETILSQAKLFSWSTGRMDLTNEKLYKLAFGKFSSGCLASAESLSCI